MWRVDRLTAAIAVAFMAPQNCSGVAEALAHDQSPAWRADVERRVDALKEMGVLVVASSEREELDRLRRWAEKGWAECFDYLRSTWDFPFENYARGGQTRDRQRMIAYAEARPDDSRFLERKGRPADLLPEIDAALEYLNQDRTVDHGSLFAHLAHTAAAAALPLARPKSRTPGADYMKRTSPSGGCRHPSELYVLALDVPGLDRGAYHVSVGERRLGHVGDLDPTDVLREKLPGAFRLVAPPRAIFVVSTVFERNMYRYREPRTLRTVFYDAGHIGGLIEEMCDRSGMIAHGHHGFQDSYLANVIASGSLAIESPAYLVSVGLASEASAAGVTVGR
jgi:SagB-type dehydrogenase family enzyme